MKKKYIIPEITFARINGDQICELMPGINEGSKGTTLDDLSKKRGSFYEEETENDFWTTK